MFSVCTHYMAGAQFAWIIDVVWYGGDQSVVLLRCLRSSGGFQSNLQIVCIFRSGVSHLLFENVTWISMISRLINNIDIKVIELLTLLLVLEWLWTRNTLPYVYASFPIIFFSSTQCWNNILGYSHVWKASLFSNDFLSLIIFVSVYWHLSGQPSSQWLWSQGFSKSDKVEILFIATFDFIEINSKNTKKKQNTAIQFYIHITNLYF